MTRLRNIPTEPLGVRIDRMTRLLGEVKQGGVNTTDKQGIKCSDLVDEADRMHGAFNYTGSIESARTRLQTSYDAIDFDSLAQGEEVGDDLRIGFIASVEAFIAEANKILQAEDKARDDKLRQMGLTDFADSINDIKESLKSA